MKKTILKISLTCLIIRVVLFCTTFGAVCAENTTTSTQTLQQVMQNGNVYDLMSYVSRKYASFPDYWGGSPITGWSYDAYAEWLDQKGLSSQLQEEVTITEGTSGGRSYNIPQDLRETMVQYVNETYIQEHPLSYKQCYIYSYKFLNAEQFNSYGAYQALQNFIKNANGYVLASCTYNSYTAPSTSDTYLVVIPKTLNLGFYGSTNNGGFTNVQLCVNWQTSSQPWYITDQIKRYIMHPDGSIVEYSSGYFTVVNSMQNISSIPYGSSGSSSPVIFSNTDKNELIYVFDTVNSYKNYNAGLGQPFYLPTGSTMTVPYNDPFTDSDLQNAGSYYSSIVDNSQSGWTAEQVLALVDRILVGGSSSGSNNAGTNNDDSFSLGFLGKIGEVITAVTGSITPMKDLVEDGIKNFLEDVFGWLPAEIVALWIAGITFAVFFGILRVIRG